MKEPRFYRNICYEVMVLFAFMQRALPVNPTVLLLCCPREVSCRLRRLVRRWPKCFWRRRGRPAQRLCYFLS